MGRPTTLPVHQTKFSNGEISPSMFGDVTHPKWSASLRTCKNWLPTPQGALVNRPGFKFVAETKNGWARLIAFVFSDAQAYLLEFGDRYLRVYQTGALVTEVATQYPAAYVPYIKYAQVGNTITLTCSPPGLLAIKPQDLTRAGGVWALADTPMKIPAGAVTWPGSPQSGIRIYSSLLTYNKGDRVFYLDGASPSNLVEWVAIQDGVIGATRGPPGVPGQAAVALNASSTGLQGNLWWMPAVDDTANPPSKLSWVQTAVVQDANGVTYESDPCVATTINTPLSLERKLPFVPTFPNLAAGYTLLYQRLYRSAGGLFGWVIDFTAAQLITAPGVGGCVYDDGRAVDFTQQPPAGTQPFLVSGLNVYPAVVGYMDQRRLFADSNVLPMAIWLSKDGDFYNWDRPTPGVDTDALLITIAGEKLEQVRSFAAMRRGVVLTGQSEWTLAGLSGGPISKTSRDLKWQSGWGSSWLNPIKIGTGLVFNTAKSNMVRDFYPLYGLYLDNWDGQELSFMARHMFDLFTLTDWAFQSVPYPVVWAVRNDGKLLSLTYQHAPPSFGQQLAEGICAWATHDTGGAQSDKFVSVCSIPEPPEDAVYAVINRTVDGVSRYFIERMNSPVCPASPFAVGVSDPRYGVYLDSAVQYDGHNVGATTMQLSGGSYVANAHPTCTASVASFASTDADTAAPSAVVLDPEGANIVCKIVGYTSPTVVTLELPVDLTAAQVATWATAATTNWGLAKSTISITNLSGYSLDTLNANGARGLNALGDGNPVAIVSLVAGVLTIQNPALVICAGASYNCDVALLDAHHTSVDIRNVFVKLVRIGFEVGGARGLWGGSDFSKLWQWQQRKVADSYSNVPLATGYFELEVTDSWSKGGRAVVRQIDPLPMVLTSALREFELGGT